MAKKDDSLDRAGFESCLTASVLDNIKCALSTPAVKAARNKHELVALTYAHLLGLLACEGGQLLCLMIDEKERGLNDKSKPRQCKPKRIKRK